MKSEIVKQKINKMHSLFEKAESIWNELDNDTKIIIENHNYVDYDISDLVSGIEVVFNQLSNNKELYNKLKENEPNNNTISTNL